MTLSYLEFADRLATIYRKRTALVTLSFMVLAASVRAQTLTNLGATAPTPGPNDISQSDITGNKLKPDGLNYYTDNLTSHSGGEPGQTFTTGAAPAGYSLKSVAFKTCGLGDNGGIGTPQQYYLHIYSVSGGIATLLTNYPSAPFTFSDGDWLQWTGLSVPLTAHAVYAWSFGNVSVKNSWEALAVAGGNPYAGGEMALISPVNGSITFGASHDFDAVFNIGLEPKPK